MPDESFEIWKAIRKHMVHMSVFVKQQNFAKAMSAVLMQKPAPTAVTKDKLAAFLLACSAEASHQGAAQPAAAAAQTGGVAAAGPVAAAAGGCAPVKQVQPRYSCGVCKHGVEVCARVAGLGWQGEASLHARAAATMAAGLTPKP